MGICLKDVECAADVFADDVALRADHQPREHEHFCGAIHAYLQFSLARKADATIRAAERGRERPGKLQQTTLRRLIAEAHTRPRTWWRPWSQTQTASRRWL